MKFENTEVWGFEHALRGMRNPKNSWHKSDTQFGIGNVSKIMKMSNPTAFENGVVGTFEGIPCYITSDSKIKSFIEYIAIGKNDMKLAQTLIRAGSEHRKFMRQIFVSVDITAPTYFMAELDTYKIGVTRNSSSFMHKGISKEFEIEDFACDDERIYQILSTRQEKAKNNIEYPYDTDEYRVYTTSSGRQYEIYRNGRVFSLPFSYTDTKRRTRNFDKREVIPSITPSGYWTLNLGGRNNERWLLHRLVAYVWIDNPLNLETVDHIDNNKNNNSVENLEWVTREENIRREFADDLGRKNNIKANYTNWKKSSKLSPFEKNQLREKYQHGVTQEELSYMFDISQSQVSAIISRKYGTSMNTELFEECWRWEQMLEMLNTLRDSYLETKDYKYFRAIRQMLPMSYLYHSTLTMNYENIFTMVKQRKNHMLSEWSEDFISWARTLPYAQEFIFIDEVGEGV